MIGTLCLTAALFVAGSEDPASGIDGGRTFRSAVQAAEKVADIRVHGNHISADADVIAMSGLKVGDPFTAATIADVTAKLKAANKFDDVSVLKRFASIEDPSQILVVRRGPGANCSSVGSVLDLLFLSAVAGVVLLVSVTAALERARDRGGEGDG